MPNIDLLNSINQKYDGTTSELVATNAQAAIDEIVAALNNLPIAFPGVWDFDSNTTEGDPGTGQFRMNTGAYATTTEFYFNPETANGIVIAPVMFPNLRAGQHFLCVEGDLDGNRIGFYQITGPAIDNTTYWTIPVVYVDEGTGGFFRNGRSVSFNFFGVGDPNSVSGPASAVDQNVAVFDGTTGKLIDDGGVAIANVIELAASNQFAGLAQKVTPVAGDQILVEDSAAAGAKVRVPFSSFGGGGGVPEAPNDANRSHFREGTTPDWTKILKGYGEASQTTLATGSESLAVDDGGVLISNLTGIYTLTGLTATLQNMSAHWLLRHNSNTVGFPASFIFPGGNPPLPTVGNTWLLGIFTVDTGTNWYVTYIEDFKSV